MKTFDEAFAGSAAEKTLQERVAFAGYGSIEKTMIATEIRAAFAEGYHLGREDGKEPVQWPESMQPVQGSTTIPIR